MAKTALSTIKNWFKTGLKPTQTQFWALFDSFYHRDEKIPFSSVDQLAEYLDKKAEKEAFEIHLTDAEAHAAKFNLKVDKAEGFGLSEENFTLAEKNYVANIPDHEVRIGKLEGLDLIADMANQKILVKDSDGILISELSVAWLNNEGTVFSYNETTEKLELRNDANELLAEVPVSAFVSNLAKSIDLTGNTLQLKDTAGNVLDFVDFEISNINGLTSALANKQNVLGYKPSPSQKIENIAALKAYEGTGNEAVEVLGYYTKGDGGGGLFYWDEISTEADNSGTIIEVTSVTTGRWKRVISGDVFAEFYGAKGDGVTNDKTAIQNALNNHTEVKLLSKTYICNDVYVGGGRKLIGSGDIADVNSGTVLKAASNGTRAVVYADQPRTFIERLVIDGGKREGFLNKGFSTDGRIYSNANFDIRIEKILIEHCTDNCFYAYNANHLTLTNVTLENSSTTLGYFDRCFGVSILECEFQFNTSGIVIKNSGSEGGGRVQGCWFEALTETAIDVQDSSDIEVESNKFLLPNLISGKSCVRVDGTSERSHINKNTFQNTGLGKAVILESGARFSKIIDNLGITYSGSPLTIQGVTDNGSVETYIETALNGKSKYITTINGNYEIDGRVIIDAVNNLVTINGVQYSINGADRMISKPTTGRLFLHSEQEISLRSKIISITKRNSLNSDWNEGLIYFGGFYFWIYNGLLKYHNVLPTSALVGNYFLNEDVLKTTARTFTAIQNFTKSTVADAPVNPTDIVRLQDIAGKRLSNVVSDLTTAEKDAFNTKLNLKVKRYTVSGTATLSLSASDSQIIKVYHSGTIGQSGTLEISYPRPLLGSEPHVIFIHNTPNVSLTVSGDTNNEISTPDGKKPLLQTGGSATLVKTEAGIGNKSHWILSGDLEDVNPKTWTPTFRDSATNVASNPITIPGLSLNTGYYDEYKKQFNFNMSIDRALIDQAALSQLVIISLPFVGFLAGQIGFYTVEVGGVGWETKGANNVLNAVNHFYALNFTDNPTILPDNNKSGRLSVGDLYNVSDVQDTFQLIFSATLMKS